MRNNFTFDIISMKSIFGNVFTSQNRFDVKYFHSDQAGKGEKQMKSNLNGDDNFDVENGQMINSVNRLQIIDLLIGWSHFRCSAGRLEHLMNISSFWRIPGLDEISPGEQNGK